MSILNFYPYYEQLLRRKEKYATIRLGDRRSDYRVGDIVTITIGWNEKNERDITSLFKVQITNVMYKQIRSITDDDLKGESPDCSSKEVIPYVLSAIYRKNITEDDFVTLIRWK